MHVWKHGGLISIPIPPQNLRLVIPDPPRIPITYHGDKEEKAWFDVYGEKMSNEHEDDEVGIEEVRTSRA